MSILLSLPPLSSPLSWSSPTLSERDDLPFNLTLDPTLRTEFDKIAFKSGEGVLLLERASSTVTAVICFRFFDLGKLALVAFGISGKGPEGGFPIGGKGDLRGETGES